MGWSVDSKKQIIEISIECMCKKSSHTRGNRPGNNRPNSCHISCHWARINRLRILPYCTRPGRQNKPALVIFGWVHGELLKVETGMLLWVGQNCIVRETKMWSRRDQNAYALRQWPLTCRDTGLVVGDKNAFPGDIICFSILYIYPCLLDTDTISRNNNSFRRVWIT